MEIISDTGGEYICCDFLDFYAFVLRDQISHLPCFNFSFHIRILKRSGDLLMIRPVLPIVREKTLFIFDLDGVIYRANDPIPSAIISIQRLQQLGKNFYLNAAFFGETNRVPSQV